MTTCKLNREDWFERMVRALTPLVVETVTAAPFGIDPISNKRYRSLAEPATISQHSS